MSTVTVNPRTGRGRSGGSTDRIPPLYPGDHLTQPEFHRRYEAMPSGTRAELIEGVVYMPSPLRMPHGKHTQKISAVLAMYEAATPGVTGADNATTILGPTSEPQPDHLMILPKWAGGVATINEDEYLVGAPELIIEVAHSSKSIDLHAKKRDYRKAGVREYLVLCLGERELRAFDLLADNDITPPSDGVFKSELFPGLWIDAAAATAGDTAKLLRTARRGLRSKEHAAFVKKLKAGAARGRT